MVKDIRPGERGSHPHALTDVGGLLYFVADDGVHGDELWKSDGTEAGTVFVKDIYTGRRDSRIVFPTGFGGQLFFSALDRDHGDELWKSDGTSEGTVMVKDIVVQPKQGSYPVYLTELNGTLLFGTDGPLELWRSDGTAAGTTMVRKFGAGPRGVAVNDFASFGDVGGVLFFIADTAAYGVELWTSDGTRRGTRLVKDIRPGYADSWPNPDSFAEIGGVLYFNANDENHGRELWRSDGTPAGTLMVKDVSPGPANSLQPYFRSLDRSFMAVGGTLYFGARDGTHGSELWKSDGTEVGTAMVKDINSGGSSYADSLTDVAGTLLFIASDGVQGGLWKSDGTEAGTTLVKALHEVDFGLTDAGNVVYVRADDGFHGRELWMSDGTETGTAMVKDIAPGEEGSFPSEFLFVAVSGSGTRGPSVV